MLQEIDHGMLFIKKVTSTECDVVLEYFNTIQKLESDWFEAVRTLNMPKAMDCQMKHAMFRTSFAHVATKASGNLFVHEEQEA